MEAPLAGRKNSGRSNCFAFFCGSCCQYSVPKPQPKWTPQVLSDPDEQLRQELVLIRAQLENRLDELNGVKERVKDSFDRISTILAERYPVSE